MIEPGHPDLSVVRRCELVSVSRLSFYYQPVGGTAASLALMRLIDAQFLETPWYGSRQMARHLRRDGHEVGRKRVRRLMALMGLVPICRRPRTTVPNLACRDGLVGAEGAVLAFMPLRGMSHRGTASRWCRTRSRSDPTEWCRRNRQGTWSSASRRCRRHWHGSAVRRFSTPTRPANSPRWSSPTCCSEQACAFPWPGGGVGWTTCSSSSRGAA